MLQVNNKVTKTTSLASLLSLLLTLNIFHYFTPCSIVFIVNFEHVIPDWLTILKRKNCILFNSV